MRAERLDLDLQRDRATAVHPSGELTGAVAEGHELALADTDVLELPRVRTAFRPSTSDARESAPRPRAALAGLVAELAGDPELARALEDRAFGVPWE